MEPCRLAFLSQTQDLFLELKRFVMYSPSTEDWHPLTLWVSPQSHFWLQPVLWIQHQLSAVAVNCFALMPNHMLNNSNVLSPCLRENYLIEKMSEAQFLTQHYGSCIERQKDPSLLLLLQSFVLQNSGGCLLISSVPHDSIFGPKDMFKSSGM